MLQALSNFLPYAEDKRSWHDQFEERFTQEVKEGMQQINDARPPKTAVEKPGRDTSEVLKPEVLHDQMSTYRDMVNAYIERCEAEKADVEKRLSDARECLDGCQACLDRLTPSTEPDSKPEVKVGRAVEALAKEAAGE